MTIETDGQYKAAFAELDVLIAEGFEGIPEKEKHFLELAIAIEAYEDSIPLMPVSARPPRSLVGLIEQKMRVLKLKQRDMARLLGVSEARLSEVLTGKRKPNLDLAKRLHERLHIDAEVILKAA